jgi:Domain of unkown function (DUF1775)
MTIHHRLRWRALTVASIICVIGAWPAYVDAHATFLNAPASVPADTDIALTMSVPHERDDTTFNVDVAIQLPDGWTGVACQTKPTWTCTMPNEAGHVVVRYVKDAGADPAEDETFQYTAHVGPTVETVSFPTLQTYNTGEVVAWIGDPGGSDPAPTLEVTAAPPTTPPPTPAPTSPPATNPSATPAPTTAAVPATTAAPVSTIASTSSSSTSTEPTTTSKASTTTSAVTTTSDSTSTASARTTSSQPNESGSDSSNAGIIVAVIVVLCAAAGTGAYLYVRRQRAASPPAE